ncbi:MAG TPA: dockerin type I repeat-containing protein [Polyangiaceae bacterium]|nr:dockerin type I repeat-containing protein [Polyangiaceae bacterium]
MTGVYRTLGAVVAAAAALASITHTTDANALGRKEYVVVLLDRSGSMLSDAYFDGTTHRSKWKEAVQQAISRVEGQRDNKDRRPSSDSTWEDPIYTPPATSDFYPESSHCYQIWTFEDTSYTVRFPTDGTWFCAAGADGFTKDKSKYATVINQINTVAAPASAGPTTPLAHSLCQALTIVRDAAQSDPLYGDPNNVQIRRSIIMQSDGLENSTPSTDQCYGSVPNTATFNPTLASAAHPGFYEWAGGLAVNSWERKVYNMAFLSDPAEPPFPWTVGGNQYWGLKPDWNFLTFYQTVYNYPEAIAIDASGLVSLNIDALFTYIPTAAAKAAATPDVDPQLQALFRNYSKSTGGRYQRIQYDGTKAALLGTAHNPPADVSDDGCVNNADYSMITQSDVYGKRDSEGQIVKRADVTRDGWVNSKDRDLVMRTWGQKRPGFQGTCP